jgi:signal transduction histidine kinase
MSSQDPHHLEFERFRVGKLFEQSILAQATGLINAGVYAASIRDSQPTAVLAVWWLSALAIFLVRLLLTERFKSNMTRQKDFDPVRWENFYALGTFFSGLLWTAAIVFLQPRGSPAHNGFLALLISGSTAGAAVAYCTSIRSVQAFFIPTLIPLIIHFFFDASQFSEIMCAMIAFYFVMTTMISLQLKKSVTDSIKLRFEKDAIVKELQDAHVKISTSVKMAALGEMAGGIAHEINNPLTIILSANDLLRDLTDLKHPPKGDIRRLTEKIAATVDRIAEIVLGLRTFAREGLQDPARYVPVKDIVAETLSFCQNRFKVHGIKLEVDPIDDSLELKCRKVQISQVLLNLLNNAFDAVKDGQGKEVRIQVNHTSDGLELAVIDDGHGVPPDAREKIMQPFFTTKGVGRGSGMGLSISSGIVGSHGGTLSLDPESKRTRFVVKLPVKTLKAAA